jgi:Protein of unknown function (DUF3105)
MNGDGRVRSKHAAHGEVAKYFPRSESGLLAPSNLRERPNPSAKVAAMASRREEKEQRRLERLARERAQLEDKRKRRVYSILAGGVLAAGAIVAVVVAVAAGGGGNASSNGEFGFSTKPKTSATPPSPKITDLAKAASAAGCVLDNPPIEGRTHVTGNVKYHTNPPTSGNHYPIPQSDGVYTQMPPLTHVVHTLEHGRVEIQYKPSIGPQRIAQLGGLYSEDPQYTLLFPNTKMPYQVAVTAWGHLAGCKKATDATFDVIRDFKRRYMGAAPEPVQTQPTNF